MGERVTITVAQTQGSVPRDVGAFMQVWMTGQSGTIGGGALEWEAIAQAREMLETGTQQMRRSFPLGPGLGQCCGGHVTLDFALGDTADAPAGPPLWIWGAGHVGTAIARVVAPLAMCPITLVDVSAARMPDDLPDEVSPLVAADPLRVVPRISPEAMHLVLTYSHDLDLRLCDSLLTHGFAFAGLIGSATKWARFSKRLQAMGHAPATIARICCPIGQPELGKHPQAIAVGVAHALLTGAMGMTVSTQSEALG